MPTSTAAAPTKLCSIATSSGIDVIATRAATNAPIDAADAERAAEQAEQRPSGVGMVASRPAPAAPAR